ncbi:protein of unknown function [Pseudomonas sp. JV551A1]|uniref:Uncharacterized protein n=1 Tax=Pseudomonas inefficax TaxID=2078786 RepID=A0AAQ1SU14_9PSED|nr:protein of unknown function [Pseudomonas sp. JV551A1]SPO61605.1 protein of unknown function [Pseudomonas inefficax]
MAVLLYFKAGAIPVGAGVPANTGEARAIHRGIFFAGTPAPTQYADRLRTQLERLLAP